MRVGSQPGASSPTRRDLACQCLPLCDLSFRFIYLNLGRTHQGRASFTIVLSYDKIQTRAEIKEPGKEKERGGMRLHKPESSKYFTEFIVT